VLTLREEIAELRLALERAAAQADHDTLTPLFNRRAFERELRREIALAQRHGAGLCLIYIDLDRFKLVNDRFGHLTGDDVIVAVAELLRRQTRESDIVGRLGGDEFGVVLPQAGLADAQRKAQALVRQVGAITVGEPDGAEPVAVRLGASAGVAAWQPGMSAEALLHNADEAMFANKAERRAPG
jgi:diguanylate cyclase (GGDEF)-like protein